jgi:Cof subfamily protein (haloacid dehalogenase superfamily)
VSTSSKHPEPLPSWNTHDAEALRAFAPIRLVAMDVDGTLQSSSVRFYDTLNRQHRQLRHTKVSLTIATGRTLSGVRPLLRTCPFLLKQPLILYNGGIVLTVSPFKVLHHCTIPQDTVAELLTTCEGTDATVLLYCLSASDGALKAVDASETCFGWSKGPFATTDVNGLHIEWQPTWSYHGRQQATAVLIQSNDRASAQLSESLGALPHLSLTRSGGTFIECRADGANKAVGLAVAAGHLQLRQPEILAVGDNDNDAEMLAWAGIGISVAGASEAAKQHSDYMCRHGVAGGVVEVLRVITQAKRFFGAAV